MKPFKWAPKLKKRSLKTVFFQDALSGDQVEVCKQWWDGLAVWKNIWQEIRERRGLEQYEGCVFTEETAKIYTSWIQNIGHRLEMNLPTKCGQCACCWEEQGKCRHGYRTEASCPRCSGRQL
jgi:hypothetical protein